MGYHIHFVAPTKQAAKEQLEQKLNEVSVDRARHSHDWGAAAALGAAYVDLARDPAAGEAISVTADGDVQFDRERGFDGVSFSVMVSVIAGG